MRSSIALLTIFVLVFGASVMASAATIDPGPIWRPSSPLYEETGVSGLYDTLMRLPLVARFASIGAHPDDDDSALLAYVSRGLHATIANVCLTRGDGGQNAIGPELYHALGVVRTGELLAARRLDGGEQYFTRAFDFGFSKTLEEALSMWGQETVLEDMVRFIRMWRPDVILNHHLSEYLGVTGHGHHQATGYLVPMAIELAADPNAYPEMIEEGQLPWTTQKVYLRGAQNGVSTLTADRGEYNPLLGRSYSEIGSESRSYHRTQTMGQLQNVGQSKTQFLLVSSTVGMADKEETFFDGIDTSISGIARHAGDEEDKVPELRSKLQAVQEEIDRIIAVFNPLYPEMVVPHLASVLGQFRDVKAYVAQSELSDATQNYINFYLDLKIEEVEKAIIQAAGLKLEVFSKEELYIPGDQLTATIRVINRSPVPVTLSQIGLKSGETIVTTPIDQPLKENTLFSKDLSLTIPLDTPTSMIFWELEKGTPGSQGSLVVQPEDISIVNQPFRPYPAYGFAEVIVDGQVVNMLQPSQYRIRDTVTGEFRDPTAVVTPISVQLSPAIRVVTQQDTDQTLEFAVQIVNNKAEERDVQVELVVDGRMKVSPALQTVHIKGKGENHRVVFEVTIPPGIPNEEYLVQAVVTDGDTKYTDGYQTIKYDHVERHHLYSPAEASIALFDLKMEKDLKIGYIMGPADGMPEALAQVGINVVLLDNLDTVDFNEFDTIVTARFAYEYRDDLVANNARLLDWVANGGVLIVQYNRGAWNNLGVSPYPTRINSDRITREDAPIPNLAPDHPIFNYPNKITEEDFEGWHQERGLYFLGEWDERFIPLMASNDPGEDPQLGGMVWTPYGKGAWIYTGYAFFRQVPGGVPGGYRLFANMLSLPKYLDK